MGHIPVDPVHWTTRFLLGQGRDVILELARQSCATTHAYRLVVGRCLLAIRESRLYEQEGYSSEIHFAISALGLSRKDACEYRRVAGALDQLPQLRRAAEGGRVPWGRLREIVRKATPETEKFWLRIAARKTDTEIQELVAACEFGKLPWEEGGEPKPVRPARWVFQVEADKEELFDRITQSLSQQLGRPLSVMEALGELAEQQLANGSIGSVKNVRKELELSVNARRRRQKKLLREAHELAQEWGLETPRVTLHEEALAQALGVDQVELPPEVTLSTRHDSQPAAGADDGDDISSPPEPGRVEELDREASSPVEPGRVEELDREASSPVEPGRVEELDREASSPPEPGRVEHVDCESRSESESGRIDREDPEDSTGPRVAEGKPGEARSGAAKPGRTESGGVKSARSDSRGDGDRVAASGTKSDPKQKVKPPCADTDFEIVTIGSDRFHELLAADYIDKDLDWENRRLIFNPRARRATAAQRREVLRRDGYCCRTPGCPHRMWLELHHTVYFSRCGDTVRANLVTLCSRCHRNVHRGLLKIRGDADGQLAFTNAEGWDLEHLHATEIAGWINFHLGWYGPEDGFHRPKVVRAA
jgi:hypothetical protein